MRIRVNILRPSTRTGIIGRIENYILRREIGSGAMGYIYEAEDVKSGKRVAVKTTQPHGSKGYNVKDPIPQDRKEENLRSEYDVLHHLEHPNIIRAFDLFRFRNDMCLVLEYLEGRELDAWKGTTETQGRRTAILAFAEASRGLSALHEAGYVHTDLKPGHIILCADGVKVIDFGLACPIMTDGQRPGRTGFSWRKFFHRQPQPRHIMVRGTTAYMSPEHLRGDVDPQSDIYSLGVVLYEVLVGEKPMSVLVESDNKFLEEWHKKPRSKLSRLGQLNPPIPRELEMLVYSCCETEKRYRPRTMSYLTEALTKIAGNL